MGLSTHPFLQDRILKRGNILIVLQDEVSSHVVVVCTSAGENPSQLYLHV